MNHPQASLRVFGAILVALLSAAAAQAFELDISGMAPVGDDAFLVVHDRKSNEPGHRVSLVRTSSRDSYSTTPVRVTDWNHADGESNDLEGACRLPGRDREYFLVESGHWNGRYGRMFHVSLDLSGDDPAAEVLGVFELPEFNGKSPLDPAGDEVEGIECAGGPGGTVLVIYGERGGSSAYRSGLIRWALADTGTHELAWTDAGRAGKVIAAPGDWSDPSGNRDISALHLDEDMVLWASAAEDPGDAGPFNSLIYRVGTVDPASDDPVKLETPYSVVRQMNGLKIEGLAGPGEAMDEHEWSIGTDDEFFGGIWRPVR